MSLGRKSGSDPQWLSSIALFSGMSADELSRVDELTTQIDVPEGEILVDQGDTGTYCYVIVEGSASVYANGEYVTTSGPGSMIGEMALVDHRPRTATVVADGAMALLRLDTRQFRTLLEEMPKASERVMAILGSRLQR